MLDITSASNAKIKYVRSLSQKKARAEHSEYTVEGIKSVRDAVSSEREVTALYVSFSFYENETFEYPENVPLYRVSDAVFEKMCDTRAPQGILAVIKIENNSFDITGGAYVYCDGIQDPGNLGMRRALTAFFCQMAVPTSTIRKQCVQVWVPFLIRAFGRI